MVTRFERRRSREVFAVLCKYARTVIGDRYAYEPAVYAVRHLEPTVTSIKVIDRLRRVTTQNDPHSGVTKDR